MVNASRNLKQELMNTSEVLQSLNNSSLQWNSITKESKPYHSNTSHTNLYPYEVSWSSKLGMITILSFLSPEFR